MMLKNQQGPGWGIWGPPPPVPGEDPMAAVSARRTLLLLTPLALIPLAVSAQTAAPAPAGATAAWTLKLKGDIRWQQVTPAGALLISTDAELAGVDIERGQV